MSRLAIRLLGSFQVSLDDYLLTAFETDKVRALLAYLAVEAARPHRRHFLAALLWPEHPEQAARNSLRQALYRLRHSISDKVTAVPRLLIGIHDIQINGTANLWLDAQEFEARIESWRTHCSNHLPLCEVCCEQLTAAMTLYQGDFMVGFTLSGCHEFEWWLLGKQEHYHRLAIEALEALGRHCEQGQDYTAVAEHAEQELTLEPWLESAHRRQMRALALSGQKYAALSHYERCRQILLEQLGTEPSPETTRLYEQIRVGTLGNRPD